MSVSEQRSDLKVSNFIAGDFEPDFNQSLAVRSNVHNFNNYGSTIRLQAEENNNIVSLDEVRKFYRASADTLRFYENKEKMTAFTLAEVLITLGVIGVVAAMTLPAFISNVQDRIKAKRVENIKQKLSKVTDKMAATSGLIGYSDTMAFVDEMKKHMSIAKVCDNNHLAECWGSTEVDLNKDGKMWEISKTKTSKTLKVPSAVQDNWADTVGIVTGDGVPMILSYDKTCSFSADKGLTYNSASATSNSLSCLSGVIDWNGGAKPNKLGSDVITFGVAGGLGNACVAEINGKCVTAAFTPTPLSKAECLARKDELGVPVCSSPDYVAGIATECGGTKNMPNNAELMQILGVPSDTKGHLELIYTPDSGDYSLYYDAEKTTALGLGEDFVLISNEFLNFGYDYNDQNYDAYYYNTFRTRSYILTSYSSSPNFVGICLFN